MTHTIILNFSGPLYTEFSSSGPFPGNLRFNFCFFYKSPCRTQVYFPSSQSHPPCCVQLLSKTSITGLSFVWLVSLGFYFLLHSFQQQQSGIHWLRDCEERVIWELNGGRDEELRTAHHKELQAVRICLCLLCVVGNTQPLGWKKLPYLFSLKKASFFIHSLANFSNVEDYMKNFTHARQVIDHWSTSSASLNRIKNLCYRINSMWKRDLLKTSLFQPFKTSAYLMKSFFYFFSRLLFITS